ncbi:hypothetical protein BABINDRAFT_169976 [Babjeviella inositovora NRRL Y-12698]|uniref:Mitochondrial carrier protein n=1 Tax=Babjeviella inositovora NRRL Y-12698 TaxID=984486 RepID=A0A1E3QYW9_9ASCO|nr:uncharacterized protein BABINDRAFT_169976 [Babjeviella inositovora NRRL Y-12698]ODQ82821.1 hypothetical protein BABINDRAFT_169976 [Babjeviella inositovora NRRL Y-12698]
MIAGSAGAAAESLLTYPFECYKVGQQLHKALPLEPPFQVPSQIKRIFAGSGSLVLGNSLKASTRFLVYNYASKFMANDHGKTTAPRVVVAASMTGIVESLWIIPFENIKTLMIHNAYILSIRDTMAAKNGVDARTYTEQKLAELLAERKRALASAALAQSGVRKVADTFTALEQAQLKWFKLPSQHFTSSIKEIYECRGVRGFLQGTGVTLLRQTCNTAVFFSTYQGLKQLISPTSSAAGATNSPVMSAILGATAAAVVVAATQPIDVVKTRVQSKYGYRNSIDAGLQLVHQEGFAKLWAGWMPRLVKFSISSGITVTVYNYVSGALTMASRETPFAAD